MSSPSYFLVFNNWWRCWKNKVKKPGVHVVIDEWIDHGVAHGQPIESKEDVLDVFIRDDLAVNELVNEVAVIGQPTDGEE